MPGFYPTRDSEQAVWWSTFNQECIDRAATFPAILDGPTLAKILACKDWTATLVNGTNTAKNFAAELSQYKDIWLDARLGTGIPAPPVPPPAISPPIGVVVGMEAFARQLARQLNAHPAMTDAIRAAMGISGSSPSLGTVRIVAALAQGNSEVAMLLGLAGYKAVAVYMKRFGETARLGVSLQANFVDTTEPLVAGQSESREYWIRGILDNFEQGPISARVLVATTP